ncbi:Fic family protein [Alteromonas sp. A079]|uniref:Fic family protein n=1 Tax=Alteromonas sp. A079 TaxID=3410268 RepID=UPI003BA17FEC
MSAHNILDVSSDCYGIRERNLIIGPRINKACFYPPKYEIVESMLNEWIFDLSKVNKKYNVSLLKLYFKFIHIHPFGDGNGRFSRAFLFSLGDHFCLFSTYVHATKGYMHNDFVKNAFALQTNDLTLSYHNGYLKWKRDFLEFIKLSQKILSEDYAKMLTGSEQVISRIICVLKIGIKHNKIESNLVNSLVSSHFNMVKLYSALLMTDSFIKNEMQEHANSTAK